jgi:hypothetical protein
MRRCPHCTIFTALRPRSCRVPREHRLTSTELLSLRQGREDQQRDIAVVKSLDDAIPAFLNYYETHPVPWERERPALYCRDTMFACLRVEQDQQDHWRAYRDDYPLLQDRKPARFATSVDAKRAADIHELDLYPNAEVIDDGLSWLPDPDIDWRSGPHLVEERVNWQRSASSLLP